MSATPYLYAASVQGSPLVPTNGATAGLTVKVTANATPTSVASTVNCTTAPAPSFLITNSGTVLVFVRVSAEATPTATAADIPLLPGTSGIIQNPVPVGTSGVAVLSSTTTAADVYFTPCAGGA